MVMEARGRTADELVWVKWQLDVGCTLSPPTATSPGCSRARYGRHDDVHAAGSRSHVGLRVSPELVCAEALRCKLTTIWRP